MRAVIMGLTQARATAVLVETCYSVPVEVL